MKFKKLFAIRVTKKKEKTTIRPDLALVVFGGILLILPVLILVNTPKPNGLDEGLVFYGIALFVACFVIGLVNRFFYTSVVLMGDCLVIRSICPFRSVVWKRDIVSISRFAKGCAFFIELQDGRRVEFSEYDSRAIRKEVKAWLDKGKK